MNELKSKGTESTKKIFLSHGIKEPLFGVKIADLKLIQKKIKKDYALSKELFATGNADAMYLAGLIADETKMTKKDLSEWVKKADSANICEYTVPWISAESSFGFELGLEWIDSEKDYIAAAGWSALSSLVSIKKDEELNIQSLKKLLTRVEQTISHSPDRVRNTMSKFVIAVGSYVKPLTELALAVGKKISNVDVKMGDIACKIPDPVGYIMKVKIRGSLGKKKKMARC